MSNGPATGDHAGGGIGWAVGLFGAAFAGDGLNQAPASAAIPTEAVNFDAVILGRVDANMQIDAAAFVDAGGRGIAFDLSIHIVGGVHGV